MQFPKTKEREWCGLVKGHDRTVHNHKNIGPAPYLLRAPQSLDNVVEIVKIILLSAARMTESEVNL